MIQFVLMLTLASSYLRAEPIIDAHVHVDFDNQPDEVSSIEYSEKQFVTEMSEAGITGFVAHTKDESILPNRFPNLKSSHCIGISEKLNTQVVEQGLKTQTYKCIKIYLGYVYHYAYDEVYKPFYQLAEKYKVPVVFHTGDTSTSKAKIKYAHPLTIDEVAVDFPNVTFVIAHAGNPWVETASEVAYKNPNVYLEVSGIMIGDLKRSKPEFIKKHLIGPVSWAYSYIESSDKLMFGSDWPITKIKPYKEALMAAIPKESHSKFFYENAARVFNIK